MSALSQPGSQGLHLFLLTAALEDDRSQTHKMTHMWNTVIVSAALCSCTGGERKKHLAAGF